MCWACKLYYDEYIENKRIAVTDKTIDELSVVSGMPADDVMPDQSPCILLQTLHVSRNMVHCPVCRGRLRMSGPREAGYRYVCTCCGEWVR